MSFIPHTLSTCCGVPIIPTGKEFEAKCSNCGNICGIDYFDDGWREHIGYVETAPIKNKAKITGFNIFSTHIQVTPSNYPESELIIITRADLIAWGIKKGLLVLLPEVEYIDGNHWDKQPNDRNITFNKRRVDRFYKSVSKPLLTNYLRDKGTY